MLGFRSLLNRMKSLTRWVETTGEMDDSGQFPLLQISYHGTGGKAVPWFPYGYHANIPIETLAVAMMIEANPENKIVFCGSPFNRPSGLLIGEVAISNPTTGSKMVMKADGSVEVTASKLKVVGDLEVTGDATIDTDLTVVGDTTLGSTVTSGGVDISDTHVHDSLDHGDTDVPS